MRKAQEAAGSAVRMRVDSVSGTSGRTPEVGRVPKGRRPCRTGRALGPLNDRAVRGASEVFGATK